MNLDHLLNPDADSSMQHKFVCRKCHFYFNSKEQLTSHSKIHPIAYKPCPYCNLSIKYDKLSIKEHLLADCSDFVVSTTSKRFVDLLDHTIAALLDG